METKNPDAFVISKTEALQYENIYLVPPVGHGAGGLALLWKQEIKLQILSANANCIDTSIEFEGKLFYASFVYGDTDRNKRKLLWKNLLTTNLAREAPWFLTGDFNDLLNNEEKSGGITRPEGSFSDFRTFFSEGDLYDLQHSGDFLSWRGQRGDHLVRCRLDRAIANSEWAELFPKARAHYLTYEGSDHKPIISYFEPDKKKRRGLFRFDRRLRDNPEIKALVAQAWKDATNSTVNDRISTVRTVISEWTKKQRLNSRKLIEEKQTELEAALTSPVNDTSLIQKVSDELNAAYLAEESYWKQRSRLLWLSLGDRNTGFFHATAKNRKRANAFSVIEDNEGNMVFEEDQIAKVIVEYFQGLFSSVEGNREDTVNYALSPMVTEEANDALISTPSPAEIREAVFSIHADKALGPDGFSAGFFHSNWESIGAEIVKEIQAFFETETLPAKINETHIRLIPKVHSPTTVAEYRPIALCNVYYKIISKILTKRLKPLLDGIISENQSAFVPGRAISDNVLITHEVLHFLKTSKAEKRCSMAVKTDMSKAYDRLEWDFIKLVLARLGFHSKWIALIMQCISTVTYSFLINGSPRGRVTPSRGIRQGDPLSPYIFILCSEVLSGLCNRAQEEGSLQGICVARGSPRLNHLLFADDTMFFIKATKDSSDSLHKMLKRYEEASGQSINQSKSSITFSRKAPASLKTAVKSVLGIQKEGGIGKYLGLPEHFGRKKRDIFSSMVDRIKQKASGWSNRHLSAAGKMTMLKSVLSPIPSYAMTCFKLPISLCKRIQSALTRFWWDDRNGNQKMAWVSWTTMTLPKEYGGLDLRDIQNYNDAFLAKLSWRIATHPESLLARILLGKYCLTESFLTCPIRSACFHGWRSIMIGRDIITQNSGWAVGNGVSINIWNDPWLSLSEQVRPVGPAPEAASTMTVSDLFLQGTNEWNIEKIREVLPSEEDRILAIKPSLSGAPDKLVWIHNESGEFTTRSGYATIMNPASGAPTNFPQSTDFNWKKSVWSLHTAPKIKTFLWKAFHGALPVGTQLRARQINVEGKCKTCGLPESINHLFLECSFAQQVWNCAPVSPGIELRGSIDLRQQWESLITRRNLPPTGVFEGPLAPWIMWHLWITRNKLMFEEKRSSAEEVISQATATAREWTISQQKTTKQPPRSLPISPRTNRVTLKTDAAWNEERKLAGLGWNLENAEGLSSFSTITTHVRSPLSAEGLAMRAAVEKCRDLGIPRIRCESDSATLVKVLNGETSNAELYGIATDILALSFSFECISFSWIPREKNSVADGLAKQVLSVELALNAPPNR